MKAPRRGNARGPWSALRRSANVTNLNTSGTVGKWAVAPAGPGASQKGEHMDKESAGAELASLDGAA